MIPRLFKDIIFYYFISSWFILSCLFIDYSQMTSCEIKPNELLNNETGAENQIYPLIINLKICILIYQLSTPSTSTWFSCISANSCLLGFPGFISPRLFAFNLGSSVVRILWNLFTLKMRATMPPEVITLNTTAARNSHNFYDLGRVPDISDDLFGFSNILLNSTSTQLRLQTFLNIISSFPN